MKKKKERLSCLIFPLFSGGEFKEVYRGLECEHTFTGLSPGHLYRIRFAAVSEGGISEVSVWDWFLHLACLHHE